MVFTSGIVVFLSNGTTKVMENYGIPNAFLAEVLTGIMFLIIIGCEFFVRYRVIFNKNIFSKKQKATVSCDSNSLHEQVTVSVDEATRSDSSNEDLLDKTESVLTDDDSTLVKSDISDVKANEEVK